MIVTRYDAEDEEVALAIGKKEAALLGFIAQVPVTLEVAAAYFGDRYPAQKHMGREALTEMVFNILEDWIYLDVLALNNKGEFFVISSQPIVVAQTPKKAKMRQVAAIIKKAASEFDCATFYGPGAIGSDAFCRAVRHFLVDALRRSNLALTVDERDAIAAVCADASMQDGYGGGIKIPNIEFVVSQGLAIANSNADYFR